MLSVISPDSDITLFNSTLEFNKEGFRDINHNLSKTNRTRIAFIGDSFTFGWGINDTNETFAELTGKQLNSEPQNFGIPGANILDIYWVMQNYVLKYNPDIIVYAVYWNDLFFLKNTPEPDNLDIEYCSLIDGRSRSYYFFKSKIDNVLAKMRNKKKVLVYKIYNDTAYFNSYIGAVCFNSILDKIKDDKRIIAFVIPSRPYRNEADINIENEFQEAFREKNIKFIGNFSERFWEKANSSIYYRDNLHFNEEGNLIIADILSDELKTYSGGILFNQS